MLLSRRGVQTSADTCARVIEEFVAFRCSLRRPKVDPREKRPPPEKLLFLGTYQEWLRRRLCP